MEKHHNVTSRVDADVPHYRKLLKEREEFRTDSDVVEGSSRGLSDEEPTQTAAAAVQQNHEFVKVVTQALSHQATGAESAE